MLRIFLIGACLLFAPLLPSKANAALTCENLALEIQYSSMRTPQQQEEMLKRLATYRIKPCDPRLLFLNHPEGLERGDFCLKSAEEVTILENVAAGTQYISGVRPLDAENILRIMKPLRDAAQCQTFE